MCVLVRERERERENSVYVYMCVCVWVCVYECILNKQYAYTGKRSFSGQIVPFL